MATKLIHKNSKVQFKNATGAQLEFGELALNYHASGPYLQAKGEDGEVHSLGGVYIGSSAPTNPLPGRWWFDDANSKLFLYDGSAWQVVTGSGGGGGGSTTVIGGDGIIVTTSGGTATVKVDLASAANGLSIAGGKLQADIATDKSLGTVKIGDGIDVDADGEISVDLSGIDVNADLGYTAAVNQGTVTNTAGDNATIPVADTTNAGLFTAAEKSKLDGIEAGAEVNVDVDLGYTAAADKGTVTNTAGDDATIPLADGTNAGLFTAAEKTKLDGIEAGAEVNTVKSIVGGDGIRATDDSGAVTIAADPNTNKGVEISSNKIAVKLGAGLDFDATGNIKATVGSGTTYKGKCDVTSATVIAGPAQGDQYANTGAGKFSSQWAAVTNNADTTTDADIGDWMIFNGTDWDHIPLSGGGLTEGQADDRYLRLDAGAGDQVRLAGKANFRDSVSVGPNKECELNVNGSATFGASGANNVSIYGDGSADFKGLTTHKSGVQVENTDGKPTVITTTPSGSLNIDSPAQLSDGGSVRIDVATDKTSSISLEGSRSGASGWTAGQITAISGFGSTQHSFLRFATSDLAANATEDHAYLRSRSNSEGNNLFGTAEKTDLAVGYDASVDTSDAETAAPIYLAADGTARFSDLTTHEGAIHVTGANTDNFENKNSRIWIGDPATAGSNYTSLGSFTLEGKIHYNEDLSDYLRKYSFQGSGPILRLDRVTHPTNVTNNPQVANFALAINEGQLGTATGYTRTHTLRSAVDYKTGFDNTKGSNNSRAYSFLAESNSEYDQLTADATAQASYGGYLFQADTSPGQFPAYDEIGFHCRSTGQKVGSLQGFVSGVRSNVANTNYSFYASGNAPNFFTGDTYIGGTTARNTFELWESTLTEEQKEQLEAGTLVAPANVSVPGDGEFARQWWYNQQSAEDQELIDSGELDYPKHLQAATFTDTFALGDNTNIKLASSDTSVFKGDIRFDSDPDDDTTGFSVISRGQADFKRNYDATLDLHRASFRLGRSGGGWVASRLYANPNSEGSSTGIHYNIDAVNYYNSGGINNNTAGQRPSVFHSLTYFQTGFDNTKTGNQFTKYNYLAKTFSDYNQGDLDPDNADDAKQIGTATGFGAWNSGPVKNYRAFEFLNSGNEGINNTGFYSQLDIKPGADNWSNYHEGNAPNYFKGGVQFDTATGTDPLEDYEEGTFTPVFTNPPAGVNYTSQQGTYVKIGTIVNIYLEVSYNNASGNDTIEINLPFHTVDLGGAANSGQGYCATYSATGSSIAGESVSVGMPRNGNKLNLVKGVIRTQNAQNSQIKFDDIPTAQLRITACYNTRP